MKPDLKSSLLSVVATLLLVTGCATSSTAPPVADLSAKSATATPTHLVALLPMRDGFGPGDQDAYEDAISPIAADHGMRREAAYTVTQFMGGAGPKNASTVGMWSLKAPDTLAQVMGDPRYQANVPQRDRVHDMANVAMYSTVVDAVAPAPAPGHSLLVGVLATKPGYGYDDHVAYENSIAAVTQRHGMRLVRSYRILQPMGAAIRNAVAVAVWELNSPDTLNRVMSDSEYVANVPNRDRVHDMAATTMYFVKQRTGR